MASARIPATRRGTSKALILATGHGVGGEDDVDWAALARTGQPIVVYMGLAGIAEIAAALMAGGLAAATPAAVIASATTPEERVVVSDLGRIADAVHSAGIRPPALIVVGAIVALREELLALGPSRGAGVSARALIIGAARSGSGKTSVSIGLMRAFRRRGRGCAGRNRGRTISIPAFTPPRPARRGSISTAGRWRPTCSTGSRRNRRRTPMCWSIESAMGLFDGIVADPGRSGAAADLARRYGIPVLLVLDVSGQSQTAAAIARGFATHDPAVRIAGVVAEPGGERPARAAGARGDRGARHPGGRGGAPQPRHGAARAASRAGAGPRARRARRVHRAAGGCDGALARPRRDPRPGAAVPGRTRRAGHRAAAPRPAHRHRRGRRLQLRLSACRAALARRGRRTRGLLAAGRPGARSVLRLPAGCRAAIRSCTPDGSAPRRAFATGCGASRPTGRCMANAAASWCSAGRSRMPTASPTRCSGCSIMSRAMPSAG